MVAVSTFGFDAENSPTTAVELASATVSIRRARAGRGPETAVMTAYAPADVHHLIAASARDAHSAPADLAATHATTQDGDAVAEGVATQVHGAEGTANIGPLGH